jgi:hypothetical protein
MSPGRYPARARAPPKVGASANPNIVKQARTTAKRKAHRHLDRCGLHSCDILFTIPGIETRDLLSKHRTENSDSSPAVPRTLGFLFPNENGSTPAGARPFSAATWQIPGEAQPELERSGDCHEQPPQGPAALIVLAPRSRTAQVRFQEAVVHRDARVVDKKHKSRLIFCRPVGDLCASARRAGLTERHQSRARASHYPRRRAAA